MTDPGLNSLQTPRDPTRTPPLLRSLASKTPCDFRVAGCAVTPHRRHPVLLPFDESRWWSQPTSTCQAEVRRRKRPGESRPQPDWNPGRPASPGRRGNHSLARGARVSLDPGRVADVHLSCLRGHPHPLLRQQHSCFGSHLSPTACGLGFQAVVSGWSAGCTLCSRRSGAPGEGKPGNPGRWHSWEQVPRPRRPGWTTSLGLLGHLHSSPEELANPSKDPEKKAKRGETFQSISQAPAASQPPQWLFPP